MRELGVVCRACFCTFYTSEMNTHSYMPFLFSINFLCHLFLLYVNYFVNNNHLSSSVCKLHTELATRKYTFLG